MVQSEQSQKFYQRDEAQTGLGLLLLYHRSGPAGISGGPIFNEDGYVIGLVSSSLYDPDSDELSEGYSFWFRPLSNLQYFLPTLDTDNHGCLRVWGVLRDDPWHLAGIFAFREQAEAYINEFDDDYRVVFGSHYLGTDDFICL